MNSNPLQNFYFALGFPRATQHSSERPYSTFPHAEEAFPRAIPDRTSERLPSKIFPHAEEPFPSAEPKHFPTFDSALDFPRANKYDEFPKAFESNFPRVPESSSVRYDGGPSFPPFETAVLFIVCSFNSLIKNFWLGT